jgi:chromate transporter
VVAAIMLSVFPTAYMQLFIIVFGGILGWRFLPKSSHFPHVTLLSKNNSWTGIVCCSLFLFLLLFLPFIAKYSENTTLQQFSIFYRVGSLVFGGGHVVLPLLQAELIPLHWISSETFLAGYGITQAVPGPLFSFAAYLGALSTVSPRGLIGGLLCLIAIFLPAFLLIVGVLPFWEKLRKYSTMQRVMQGVNASVVGLLLAAFYSPVWTSSISNSMDFALVIVAFLLLTFWQVSPVVVVALCSIAGAILA